MKPPSDPSRASVSSLKATHAKKPAHRPNGPVAAREWDFLPVIKLLCLTKRRRLLSWGAPSRPVERSTVLPLPRTLRADLCQCRCAASRTALARGALPKVGRDEGMSVPVELRDRCDLRRCRRTMVGVE